MVSPTITPPALEGTAHIIQLALTPVFLLGGIATLLGVFGARLARVADQADTLAARLGAGDPRERAELLGRIAVLRRRSLILDAAVILGSFAGVAVCGAVLTLFVGALGDAVVASILFASFGLGILCTLFALAAFGVEMLLASRASRAHVARIEERSGRTGDG